MFEPFRILRLSLGTARIEGSCLPTYLWYKTQSLWYCALRFRLRVSKHLCAGYVVNKFSQNPTEFSTGVVIFLWTIFFLDENTKTCVPPSKCTCSHNGDTYLTGETMSPDNGCNTCTCDAGSWSCTEMACPAECSAVGDPHYTTFDGVLYDFQVKQSILDKNGKPESVHNQLLISHWFSSRVPVPIHWCKISAMAMQKAPSASLLKTFRAETAVSPAQRKSLYTYTIKLFISQRERMNL